MVKFTTKLIIGIVLALFLGSIFRNPVLGFIVLLAVVFGFKDFKLLNKEKKDKIVDIGSFKKTYIGITAVVLAILIFFFRPWFHEVAMGIYTTPLVWFFFISLMAAIILFVQKKKSIAAIFIGITILSFVALSLNDVILQRYIVKENVYNEINSLPDSTDIRILPKAVALRYLEDSLQKSREKIGGINIVNLDSGLFWMAPRVPDGDILYFTQKVNGVMTADATKTDRETKMVAKKLSVGEEIGVTDNIYWRIFKHKFFVDLGDVYYIYKNDKILTIAPVISYRFKFPVMIPYFSGVIVLDESGTIKEYSPTEVAQLEEFSNNRAYPSELARLYVDSYKFNLGVINTWFLHKDQIEISDVYGQANRQPFLMPTTEGLKWIVATEPFGESYGVFKIFMVDALTGRIDMLELNEDQTLTGPVKVISYVKKKFPIIDWGSSRIIEPRPFVINGKLFWMMSITPNDYAGIAYTVFVNSENNEVTAFDNDEGVYNFIKKGISEDEVEITEEGTIGSTDKTTEELRQEKIDQIEKLLEELKALD
jgi:hypothetical protein